MNWFLLLKTNIDPGIYREESPLNGDTLPALGRISTGNDLGLVGRDTTGSARIAKDFSRVLLLVGTALEKEEVLT